MSARNSSADEEMPDVPLDLQPPTGLRPPPGLQPPSSENQAERVRQYLASRSTLGPRSTDTPYPPWLKPSPKHHGPPLMQQTNCRFLSLLPAEMRNLIYDAILLEPHDIIMPAPPNQGNPIGSAPPEPGLLSTCRQIRCEAIKIYYQRNRFRFLVPDFNATNYIKWTLASPRIRGRLSVGLRLVSNTDPNFWKNLIVWLAAIFHKQIRTGPSPNGATNVDWRVAGHMVYMVRKCREKGLTWEQTRKMLQSAKDIAAVGDPKWAV